MNKSLFAGITALLMLSCASEDRSDLRRRPLEPTVQNGWARVRLDGEAQRDMRGLWISDADGNSIPYLMEREGLWAPQVLETTQYLAGKDASGNPTAEFALVFPKGWQVREREQLRLDLDLEGKSPWVARVDISRRTANGGFLTLERDSPFFVYDLSNDRHTSQITLPWDAERYRVTLVSTQGKAPILRGLRVTASTWPEQLEADEVVEPRVTSQAYKSSGEFLKLSLPNAERVVAADVLLKAPVAPVYVTLEAEEKNGTELQQSRLTPLGGGTVWNLPALQTRATRVALSPTITDEMHLQLPENTTLESVKLLIRHEAMLFPAEASKPYYLHFGGRAKRAAGNLGVLPPSRAVYGRNPLKLMPIEADPQGLGIILDKGDQTRPWLAWVVGLIVLILGFAAFRLLRNSDG